MPMEAQHLSFTSTSCPMVNMGHFVNTSLSHCAPTFSFYAAVATEAHSCKLPFLASHHDLANVFNQGTILALHAYLLSLLSPPQTKSSCSRLTKYKAFVLSPSVSMQQLPLRHTSRRLPFLASRAKAREPPAVILKGGPKAQ